MSQHGQQTWGFVESVSSDAKKIEQGSAGEAIAADQLGNTAVCALMEYSISPLSLKLLD